MYSSYPPFGPPSSVHNGSSTLEGVLKNGAAAAAAAAMNMHTMQLEWLARTGMLYHRFPELAGKFYLDKGWYAEFLLFNFLSKTRLICRVSAMKLSKIYTENNSSRIEL
jgi:hypothetical protein